MDIKVFKNNQKVTIEAAGRIDTVTAPELENAVKDAVNDAQSLVIDLEKVEYISSAGLRVLLSAHKAMSTKYGLKLVNVSSDIMEIFEVTGFSDILNIQ